MITSVWEVQEIKRICRNIRTELAEEGVPMGTRSTILRYAFIVGLAIFVIFYWAIDIIMNNILIYLGKYEIEEIE